MHIETMQVLIINVDILNSFNPELKLEVLNL